MHVFPRNYSHCWAKWAKITDTDREVQPLIQPTSTVISYEANDKAKQYLYRKT